MVVCVCNNISEALVMRSIDEGARTCDEVMEKIGVDLICETCRPFIEGILDASI